MRTKINLSKKENDVTLDKGYDEFILYCKSKNLRPATIKHYDASMSIVYKSIPPKTLIRDITPTTVENFKIFMSNKTNENDVSRNTNIRSLRTILYYFMYLGYMDKYHIAEIRVDKKSIVTYSDEELALLLKKPDLKKCKFTDYRDWAIINFLLGTGCRLSTLINIKIEDVDFENDLISYSHTKNRKSQLVPISYNLKKVLIEYLQFRKGEQGDYLFCTAYSDKINQNTLSKTIADYNKRQGVNKTGVHRFRHTFAKKWILGGGDIFRLQKMLGHSTMDMVKIYVDMFTDDLQQDFNKFNPLEQMRVGKKRIKLRR